MGAKPLLPVALGWEPLLPASAQAVISLNEAHIDPPGSSDNGRKFIEFAGPPGMSLWSWNGGRDTPGQLGNDGSFTMALIHHPSGQAKGDPTNLEGVPWGRDITEDAELITPVTEPQDGPAKHQWSDGWLPAPGVTSTRSSTLTMG